LQRPTCCTEQRLIFSQFLDSHSLPSLSSLPDPFARIRIAMKFFAAALAACTALAGVVALPTVELSERAGDLAVRANTASQTGTNNGFYYSFWTSGSMAVTYTNGNAGAYTVNWQGNGDFTSGKGWNPGSARYVCFPQCAMVYVLTLIAQDHQLQHVMGRGCELERVSLCLRLVHEPARRILHRRELWYVR
jgi:hypothetical protein